MIDVVQVSPGSLVHLVDETNTTVAVLQAQPWSARWVATVPGPKPREIAFDDSWEELVQRVIQMRSLGEI